MTDQELIWICFEPVVFPYPKILYGSSDPNGDKDIFVPYVPADRIEELVKERDDYKDLYYAAFKDAASLNIHYAEIGYKAKTAEAKLAKAVGSIKQAIKLWEGPTYGDREYKLDNAYDGFELLCTTLVELEKS